MKKYLMTGIAAVAMCAAFTSCSHDVDPVSQEDLNKIEAQKIVEGYKTAFVQVFGQPAADQDWGFGSVAKTRAWNVNGNQWHDGVNYNYEYDAKVTTDEMNKVFNYVNDKNNVETVDQISFQEYWVSQIWNGKDDANADGVKAPATTTYPNQNGATTTIIGGGQMDKLMIKETTSDDSWIHCNNFNAADNNDWKEGGEGGRTLMTSSGTYSFGYTNSQASYFSTKYIIVPGAKIDASLKDFYYVCFDFERHYVEGEEEKTMGSYEVWNGNNYQGGYNFSLDGHLNEAQVKAAIGQVNGRDIQNINIKGYLYGDKHCDGDDNYTDWIVRISPARTKGGDTPPTPNYSIRVIGEDLTYNAANPNEADFDFNDVVFDVALNVPGKTYIKLKAAGGTLPLIIGIANPDNALDYNENEVHHIFGNYSINTMINTGAAAYGSSADGVDDAILELDTEYDNAKDIPIFVKKSGVWCELTAVQGEPASKIGVPTTFQWCAERVSMKGEYPLFVDWVKADANHRNFIWW